MKPFDVYSRFPINIKKGKGNHVWDEKGTKYLDLYGGHAVISIGHSHPHYVSRIKSQLDNIGFYSNSIEIPIQDEATNLLGQLSGYEDYNFFFCNSGAEAIENALKVASFHNGRERVLSFINAFHGRTSLAVSITDNAFLSAPVNESDHVTFIPWNDRDAAVHELHKEEYCAVVIEGIQGVGGIHIPNDDFLQFLSKEAKNSGTPLILDEIQSGFGRTGKFFAHQYAEIKPDLITVAKGMGNGFPTAGVLISPEFEAKPGMLGTTFGGNHLACAAMLAVLEVIDEENLLMNAELMGERLTQELRKIGKLEVRGRGLMLGIDFPFPIKELRSTLLFEHKIFTGNAKTPNTLRLLPPLTLREEDVEYFAHSLKNTLTK